MPRISMGDLQASQLRMDSRHLRVASSDSTFESILAGGDNGSPAFGGIIYIAGGMATVSNCDISSNICYADGGGIYNAGAASALTVSNSTFSGNTDGPSGSPDNIFGPYTDGGGNTFN